MRRTSTLALPVKAIRSVLVSTDQAETLELIADSGRTIDIHIGDGAEPHVVTKIPSKRSESSCTDCDQSGGRIPGLHIMHGAHAQVDGGLREPWIRCQLIDQQMSVSDGVHKKKPFLRGATSEPLGTSGKYEGETELVIAACVCHSIATPSSRAT